MVASELVKAMISVVVIGPIDGLPIFLFYF